MIPQKRRMVANYAYATVVAQFVVLNETHANASIGKVDDSVRADDLAGGISWRSADLDSWRPRLMKEVSKTPKTKGEVRLRIVLVSPPAGADFGIQDGKGNDYETIQKQRSKGADLTFEFAVSIKGNRDDGLPNFLGLLTQGPTTGRFIYIDIGKLAGQPDSCWERRIKVPLGDISWDMIEKASADPKLILEVRLPGTGRDGGPSCATVKPAQGWSLCRH